MEIEKRRIEELQLDLRNLMLALACSELHHLDKELLTAHLYKLIEEISVLIGTDK